MQDGIFPINVGQVEAPAIGGGGRGVSGVGGSSLNNLLRYQQKMLEIQAKKEEQATKNANELFGDAAKKIGFGVGDRNKTFGFEPRNRYQDRLLGEIDQKIQEQVKAFAGSDMQNKNYAQFIANVRKLYSDPRLIEQKVTNDVFDRTLKQVEDNKLNMHPMFWDEVTNFQNSDDAGLYDISVIKNFKDYQVDPIDIEGDLKHFKDKGLNFRTEEEPLSGQVMIVTTQNNKDYINAYNKGKYSKNFGLDYDRLAKNSDLGGKISREDYINQRIKELSDPFVTQENAQKIQLAGKTLKRQQEESNIEIEQKRKEEEIGRQEYEKRQKILTEQDRIREGQSSYAPQRESYKGTSKVVAKNPYGTGKPIHKDVFNKMTDKGLIDPSNSTERQNWIDGEIKSRKLDKLSGNNRQDAINKLLVDADYQFARGLNDQESEIVSSLAGKRKDDSPLEIKLKDDGSSIDLSKYETRNGVKTTGFGLHTTQIRPGFMIGKGKEPATFNTRFVPDGVLSNGDYKGSLLTDDPEIFVSDQKEYNKGKGGGTKGLKITGEEANALIGEDIYPSDAEIYRFDGKGDAEAYGYMSSGSTPLGEIISTPESGGDYNAQNKDTSAYGKYQFTDDTGFGIAKELGIAKDIADYKEKIKDPDFQDKLWGVQEKRIEADVAKLEDDMATDENLGAAAKETIARALNRDKLSKIPNYILAYLRHHQGSDEEVKIYLQNGKDAVKDGAGLEIAIRRLFREHGFSDYNNEQIAETPSQTIPKPTTTGQAMKVEKNVKTKATKIDTTGAPSWLFKKK